MTDICMEAQLHLLTLYETKGSFFVFFVYCKYCFRFGDLHQDTIYLLEHRGVELCLITG